MTDTLDIDPDEARPPSDEPNGDAKPAPDADTGGEPIDDLGLVDGRDDDDEYFDAGKGVD